MHDDKKRVCIADLQGKLPIEAIDIVCHSQTYGLLTTHFFIRNKLADFSLDAF